MQNPSALIHAHNDITLPDEAEGFPTVFMGDVTPSPPFHTIGTAYSGGSCVNN